jgi:hypothetical protein
MLFRLQEHGDRGRPDTRPSKKKKPLPVKERLSIGWDRDQYRVTAGAPK